MLSTATALCTCLPAALPYLNKKSVQNPALEKEGQQAQTIPGC
jgi:hypothetical protein